MQFVVHSTTQFAKKHLNWKGGVGYLRTDEAKVLGEMWEVFASDYFSKRGRREVVSERTETEGAFEGVKEEHYLGSSVVYQTPLHYSLFVWDHTNPIVLATLTKEGDADHSIDSDLTSTSFLSPSEKIGVCGDFFQGLITERNREHINTDIAFTNNRGVEKAARSGLDLADRLFAIVDSRTTDTRRSDNKDSSDFL